MKERRERRLAWLLNRRLGIALMWMALAIGIAVAANLVGIRMLGGIEAWSHWLRAHAGYFSPGGWFCMERPPGVGGGCTGVFGSVTPQPRHSLVCGARRSPRCW